VRAELPARDRRPGLLAIAEGEHVGTVRLIDLRGG
jgi:hypothetical protein